MGEDGVTVDSEEAFSGDANAPGDGFAEGTGEADSMGVPDSAGVDDGEGVADSDVAGDGEVVDDGGEGDGASVGIAAMDGEAVGVGRATDLEDRSGALFTTEDSHCDGVAAGRAAGCEIGAETRGGLRNGAGRGLKGAASVGGIDDSLMPGAPPLWRDGEGPPFASGALGIAGCIRTSP